MRGFFVLICLSLMAIVIAAGGVDQNSFPTNPGFLSHVQLTFSKMINHLAFATVFGGTLSFWLLTAFASLCLAFFIRLYRKN
ncbi:hypothetical protein KQH40_00855 [bacterium]|nr:hypothetical protein [bacterium]